MNTSVTKVERILLVGLPLLLIYELIQALFFPDAERPSAGLKFLIILFDILGVIGVVGLSIRRLKSTDDRDGAGPWLVLAGIGLLAGLAVLIIHLSGGTQSELRPRSTASSSERSEAPDEIEQFGTRLGEVATSYSKAETAVEEHGWTKASGEERRKRPRKELQDFLKRERELVSATDKVIAMLKEPDFEIKLARLVSFAAARGHSVAASDIRLDAWLVRRRIWAATERHWTIVDVHWDEWRATPGPPEGEPKPWQKEMADQAREGQLAEKEYEALSAAADVSPIEAPVLTQSRGRLAAVVHDLRRQFGAARVFKEIEITRDGVAIVVRDPKNPARTVSYSRDHKSLAKEENFTPSNYSLLSEGDVRDTELFGLDEADWTRVPAIVRAALGIIPLPGGRVMEVALVRQFHPLQENPVEWKVQVKNGGLLDGEHGYAFFDSRSAELTELELPKSLAKSAAYLTPENTRALLANILQDFGPETRFIEFSIDDNRALLTATRPKHPDDLRRYGYTATERAKLGKHNPIPVQDPKARNGLFTAADVAGFVPQLDKLRQRAFERLKMKDGRLTGMAFWRQHMVHGANKKLLLELRCDSPTLGDGVVIYEVSGKEFYVALP